MAYPTDNPMDGRGPEPADDLDGGIYAEGCEVRVRSKRTARGITLGGPIAEAQNEQTAAEIARRCAAFEPMLEELKQAAKQFRFYERQHLAKGSEEGEAKAAVNSRFAARIEAIIASAEGR